MNISDLLPHSPFEGPFLPSGLTPKWPWVESNSIPSPATTSYEKIKIGTSCIPCSVNHISVCSGLLSEALRFARKEGIADEEVIRRIGLCQDELNAMERVDLRPEVVVSLGGKDKDMADYLLNESRNIRHEIESMTNADDLEKVAAKIQRLRTDVGQKWLVSKLSSEQRDRVRERAKELLDSEV